MAPYDIRGAFTVGDNTGNPTVVSPGANGQVLSSDNTQLSGLRWVALAGGGDMLLSAAQANTGLKTFDSSSIAIKANGSTGITTFVNANTGVTNYTITYPAVTGTVALLNTIDSSATFSDTTNNNVNASRHGFVPKAPNVSTLYLDGTGAWSTPAGGGGTPWATPGTIGSTTPNTGAFTTLSATGAVTGTSFNSITGFDGTLPVVAGTAATGAASTVARRDHVHPAQTTVSGNAGTVTNATLTTALTINTGTVSIAGNAANNSVLTLGAGASSISGANTGDNATNSQYSADYRAGNPPPLVTTTTNGYMSSTDKVKLNKIGTPLRITVMGDSISSPQTMRTQHWTDMLEMLFNQTGTNTAVTNLAIAGYTANAMTTTMAFGSNTMVQQCIASTPDIVIVMVGANDASGARTLAEIQGDITSVATSLRAGLPTAKLVFSSEIIYDKTNFTAANAKLKGIIPLLQAYSLPSAGITAGSYGTEMLNNVSGAAVLNILSRLDSFNTTATGLVQWDALITHDHWKLARLGFMMYDGIHPNSTGMLYMATNILKGLSTASFASTLYPGITQQITNITSGLDTLFSKVLTVSGDGYTSVYNNADGEDIALEQGILRSIHTDTWFYPYKTRAAMYPLSISYDASSTVYVSIDGGALMVPVQISINGAAFTSTTTSTDAYGRALLPLNGTYFGTPASYTIRIKVGVEIYGPYTQVITSSTFAAGTNYVAPTGSDGIVTRQMFRDTGYTFFDSTTNGALDYTNGSMQRWAPASGAQSFSVINWPPSGNLGELLVQGINLATATITWNSSFPINWVKSDGTFTTTFASSGVTLQSSGTDFVMLWTRDGGTTIYGKVIR
jgi:lysophospholipase L1-like esterase